MKKINSILSVLLLTASVFLTQQSTAQAPQRMSYQSVLRNSSNVLFANTQVGIRISVLQGTATGTAVYEETQTATTNANGLVSLQIGTGTTSTGTFATINWAAGPYFIKTETDPAGGTNYTITGTQEMLSVPYAMYAAKSGDTATTWSQSGNAGTGEGTNFIGTTDNIPFSIRVNNQPAGYISPEETMRNTHLGYQAGNYDLDYYPDGITAIGYQALYSNLLGSNNTAIGAQALYRNIDGIYNNAIGVGALFNNTNGSYNTANGLSALNRNTTGTRNVAMGYHSLRFNTTGTKNVAIGESSLLVNTTGTQNTAVGSEADVVTNALTNATAIGYGAKVNASNTIQLGNSSVTDVNTSGTYTAGAVTYPNTDGAAGQVLKTNGAGILSWVNPQSGPIGPQGPEGPQGVNGQDGATGLPSGTTGQTLRHNGTDWVANSTLYNDGSTIGVGTSTPNAETSLDIATQLPVRFPSMTQTQINNIAAPVEGMVQFNTDAHKLQVYAMLTNNASILNEIYLGTEIDRVYDISQNGISPIDGQIIAVELLLKNEFSYPRDIYMIGQGEFIVPSFGSFTWFTFVLPNPIAVTAGNQWSINFTGGGVRDRVFATNSNYPNGSGGGSYVPGANDLLFRVHIQPNPGSYGWQNMH
jgi:hypothetical protein